MTKRTLLTIAGVCLAVAALILLSFGQSSNPNKSGGVVNGTAGQLAWYATTGGALSGNANATISTGALTLGQSAVAGSLILNGATSGTTTLSATATLGTLNLGSANAQINSAGAPITSSGFTLAGLGTPLIVYSTPPAASTTTISQAMSAGVTGTHSYRYSAYINETVIGNTCSGNTTGILTVVFTDPSAAGTTTQSMFPAGTTSSTVTITTVGSLGTVATFSPVYFAAKASTSITETFTITPDTCTTQPTVQLYGILELIS